jgi:4-amino-4-deoxy-L-arabinose transferase-like glycosyltransferase
VHQGADIVDGRVDEIEISPILDRAISLDFISWFSLAWVAVFLGAFLLRVSNWSVWPLSSGEARLGSDALAIVQGGSIPASASTSPLPTSLTALALFLFGSSDGIVRLVPLLAGLGTIALIAWLRPFAGRGFTLAAATVVAVSPTLVEASRGATAGGLLVFSSLLAFTAGLRWLTCHSTGYGILFGIAAAMTVLSSPLGWIALPLVTISMTLIADERQAPALDVPIMLLAAGVTILVVSTTLFVHLSGFSNFFRESFRVLWDQHLTNAGNAWHLAGFELLIDEAVAVLLGAAAAVLLVRSRETARESRAFVSGLLLWTVIAFVFASLLGGKDDPLFTLTALPLALLAGAGLQALASRVNWASVVAPRGILFVILVPITFFAGVSTYGLLTSDVGSDAFGWLFTFLLVAIVVFAPLLALTIWLRRSLVGWDALVVLFAAVLLAGIGIRSSALLGDTINSRPGEPLNAGNSQPAVAVTVAQIRAVSRDMTTFQQDVRDPTGGHGLSLVIDSSIDEPFRWYFRDFPNVTILDPSQQVPVGEEPQVLISRSDHATMLASKTNRLERTLPLESTAPAALSDPSFSDLLRDVTRPGRWQRFPEFLVNRQVAQPAEPAQFTLSLRQDVVTQLYGGNPPPSNP